MTVLILLALCALTPLLVVPLRRIVRDPVLPVATVAALLLAAAATVAAATDQAEGWRLTSALVLAVAAATTAGSFVVRAVFRLMRREFLPRRPQRASSPGAGIDGTPEAGHADAGADEAARPEAVLRGGAWIGYLERAAVAVTVLAGWPEGMALVLAVKGVGRYAELRETNAPETFIIGTLASLLWAVAAAGIAHLLR